MILRLFNNRQLVFLKPILRRIFLILPPFLSSAIWSISRSEDPRRPDFETVFEAVAASGIYGDYLEFGVYRGLSFFSAYQLAQQHKLNQMKFFAFDSFQGLPMSEGQAFQKGEFNGSKKLFIKLMKESGVDMSRTVIVEGQYSDSLNRFVKDDFGLKKAAVIHVDCDLYSSTKVVLNFIEDLIQSGTILIFDDWNAFDSTVPRQDVEQFGEQRAFKEWRLSSLFESFGDKNRKKGKAFIMR